MTKEKQPTTHSEPKIHMLRGQGVMLGIELARLHRIAPEALDQSVERNLAQFPGDTLLRLTPEESEELGLPVADSGPVSNYAFTAEGVAVLAGILFDERELHERGLSRETVCKCRK